MLLVEWYTHERTSSPFSLSLSFPFPLSPFSSCSDSAIRFSLLFVQKSILARAISGWLPDSYFCFFYWAIFLYASVTFVRWSIAQNFHWLCLIVRLQIADSTVSTSTRWIARGEAQDFNSKTNDLKRSIVSWLMEHHFLSIPTAKCNWKFKNVYNLFKLLFFILSILTFIR